jgi:hypothetical protein
VPNRFANPGFEAGTAPWFFSWPTEQQNLRRTYRRASYVLTRLLANLGVRWETPLLARFATPVSGPARDSVVRDGGFQLDADQDGRPDQWEFSANLKGADWRLESPGPEASQPRGLRLTAPAPAANERGGLMLAQQGVPLVEGQWYRLSLRARAEGLGNTRVTVAVQDTSTWRPLLEYQRFAPGDAWKEFAFLVRSTGTAPTRTRFQIWHDGSGVLWLADVRLAPCDPPSQGRWAEGLYLDQVQEWDDPYRFFRW